MSIIISNSLYPETLRQIDAGSINGTYTIIGPAFENPIRIFHLQNLTDESVYVSWNGVDNHELVAAGGFILFDATSNKDRQSTGMFFVAGTRIYVKSFDSDPTEGVVTLATFYGRN